MVRVRISFSFGMSVRALLGCYYVRDPIKFRVNFRFRISVTFSFRVMVRVSIFVRIRLGLMLGLE